MPGLLMYYVVDANSCFG